MKFLKVATFIVWTVRRCFEMGRQEKGDNVAKILPIANEAGVKILPRDTMGPAFPHSLGVYASELTIFAEEVGIPATMCCGGRPGPVRSY